MKNRRLLNVGGIPTQKGMIAEDIPSYLQGYLDRVNDLRMFGDVKANHILLNEYLAGQVTIKVGLSSCKQLSFQGIMSHFDGPLFYPTISTLSVGSHTILEFHQPRRDEEENLAQPTISPSFKLLVEARSLLILKDDLYHKFMHSISEFSEDDVNDPLIRNLEKTSFTGSGTAKIPRSTRFSLTIRNVPRTSKLKLKFGK